VRSLRGQKDGCAKVHSSHQEARVGEEALRVGRRQGGRRADLGDLLLAGLALFCLGILLSFLATATTTVVSSAPAETAVANVDGEASVQLDKEASYPLTPAAQEARETEEELSVRASLLMSMLVVAASSFFTSGLVLLATNSSLKRGVMWSFGFLLGSSVAGRRGASLLGVFLL
jgi:hypothetical protein